MIQPSRKLVSRFYLSVLTVSCCLLGADVRQAFATIVVFEASKDTMIFENNVDNGAGGSPGFFAGTNSAMSPRRGLIAFDVSSIPSNATITVVSLSLRIGQIAGSGGGSGGGGIQNLQIGLHKLFVAWGEARTGESDAINLNGVAQGAPADPGDATWHSRFFGTASTWGVDGGQPNVDYASAASASLVQSNTVNTISWWKSTPALVADVQSWANHSSQNNGWMLINTNESAAQTFRGFYSRDFNPDPSVSDLERYFPHLIVSYHLPEPSAMALVAAAVGLFVPICWRSKRRHRDK